MNRFLILLGLLLASPALAQQPGCLSTSGCQAISVFQPSGSATLSASVVSSNRAFPSTGTNISLLVTNSGPSVAYVLLGNSSVVATTAAQPIQSGQSVAFPQGLNTNIAAITAGGSASLLLQSGVGTPTIVYGSFTATVTTAAPTLAYGASTSVSVGITSGVIITAATYSTALMLCTLPASTSNVWLNLTGGAAVVGKGTPIAAGGGCATFGPGDQPVPTAAITAITDSGSPQSITLSGG